jgi:hypothetical protein
MTGCPTLGVTNIYCNRRIGRGEGRKFEQFSNLFGLSGIVRSGFLPRKKPLRLNGSGLQSLEN